MRPEVAVGVEHLRVRVAVLVDPLVQRILPPRRQRPEAKVKNFHRPWRARKPPPPSLTHARTLFEPVFMYRPATVGRVPCTLWLGSCLLCNRTALIHLSIDGSIPHGSFPLPYEAVRPLEFWASHHRAQVQLTDSNKCNTTGICETNSLCEWVHGDRRDWFLSPDVKLRSGSDT